ncbi:MAG: hypothetical protein ACRDTR_19450 [Rubrobacter sp.]
MVRLRRDGVGRMGGVEVRSVPDLMRVAEDAVAKQQSRRQEDDRESA